MVTTRRVPRRWLNAGMLLGLGFFLGLLSSGVVGQLFGGGGSTALAAEAESPSPTPGPTPTAESASDGTPPPATPTPTSRDTSSDASPTPTAAPAETSEEEADDDDDDDGPPPIPGRLVPRVPEVPISAERPGSADDDGGDGTGSGPGSDVADEIEDLVTDTPGGATAEDVAAAQQVIKGPVYVTLVYQERIDIEIEQDAEGNSGDALASSQVIGAVTGGDTTVEGRNSTGGSGGSIAESGAAIAANSIEVTGPFVDGGIDWSNVAIAGPVSWSVVFEDDVDIKFKQKGRAASGSALADSQSFGINAEGDVDLGAWNIPGDGGGGESSADSGDATVDNAIDIRSSLVVGDFVLSDSTLDGDLVQNVSYLDDVEVSFKQSFLSLSGIAAAASQHLDSFNTGGDADVVIDNRGTGTARSGDSSGSNVADAGPSVGNGSANGSSATESDSSDASEPSTSPSGGEEEPSVEQTTVDTRRASATMPVAGIAQASLLAGALAAALVHRRPGRRTGRRRQTSRAGRP